MITSISFRILLKVPEPKKRDASTSTISERRTDDDDILIVLSGEHVIKFKVSSFRTEIPIAKETERSGVLWESQRENPFVQVGG